MSDISIKSRKATLVIFFLLLATSVLVWVRGTGLPYRGPQRSIATLDGEVAVRWDSWGVPHVKATTEADLARVLGWLHANDRLTQMEMGRRAGRGLLSEAFGEDFVQADRYFRHLGLARTADRMYAEASDTSRLWLDAYAEGVNAWIEERSPALQPELRFLGIEPAPWQGSDGFLYALLMTVDMSFWDDRPEEERFQWLRAFGSDGVRELLGDPELHVPPAILAMARSAGPVAPDADDGDSTEEGPPTEAAKSAGMRGTDGSPFRLARFASVAGDEAAIGSNNWAITGDRAAGGEPMIANDPHLGLFLPSVWYQVHLRAPGFEAQGMSLPGTPGVVIGRGTASSWALTSVMLDDHDLFFERLNEEGTHVWRGGVPSAAGAETAENAENAEDTDEASGALQWTSEGSSEGGSAEDGLWLAITEWQEVIPIRGGGSETVTLRATDLGPLLDPDPERGLPARSLRWTGREGGDPMAGFHALALASTPEQVFAAMESYASPAMNLVVALAGGEVFYTAIGVMPERGVGDGRLPSPAWDPAYHWAGLRPRDQNPRRLAPEDDVLVTANHDIRPPDYGRLPAEFFPPYRHDRIRQRLVERADWDRIGFGDVQFDHVSLFARRVVASISDVDLQAAAPEDRDDAALALDTLRAWDGSMAAQGPASGPAALFVLTQRHLLEEIFGDERAVHHLEQPVGHRSSLLDLLEGKISDRWFDDARTDDVDESTTPGLILGRALAAAWRDGVARWGSDVGAWDHGTLHQLVLRHRLDAVPVLGWWLRRGPFRLPGHATTVNALGARWLEDGSHQEITYGPSMRWVVDWSDPDRAWAVLPGGQSGHPADEHYGDQLRLWTRGALHEAPWSEDAIEIATVATTVFSP